MAQISCPKCNSLAEQGNFASWQWIVSICFFPIGLLSLLAGRQPSSCKNCNYAWKAGMAPPVVIETRHVSAPAHSPPPLVSPAKDVYSELIKLNELKTNGLLSDSEFDALKKKLLAQ